MCEKAAHTLGAVMEGIEPDFTELLTITGIATTPDGVAAINAFKSAQELLSAWQDGTNAQNVIAALQDFSEIFQGLPIPEEAKTLEAVIAATVSGIIGTLEANDPTTTTTVAAQHEVTARTVMTIKEKVPEFKYHKGIFAAFQSSPTNQVKQVWNHRVDALVTAGFTKYQPLHRD